MIKKTCDIEIEVKSQEMVYCILCSQLKTVLDFTDNSNICIDCKENIQDGNSEDQSPES